MAHPIINVERGSIAESYGVRGGDAIISINGEPLLDEIDYQALSAPAHITLEMLHADGKIEKVSIHKQEGDPLGIRFGESMALSPRVCHNQCAFCFVDQMPSGLRGTLYVKDDDWRFSLMMGNFVTLTNVNDTEFERILRRKASPLYISVHATNPQLRCRMMNNRFAGDILERLERLKDAGIRFHCQIVLCPGINDGDELMKTLQDLCALAPAAASVALVPVGITQYRKKLTKLTPFDQPSAQALLQQIAPFQENCKNKMGTTFVFPSDEFFCMAKSPIPPEDWYEGYPQIENGVGLLRRLETEMEEAEFFAEKDASVMPQRLVIATGVSAAPHILRLAKRFAPKETEIIVLPITNYFFGDTITVTGLLTGRDILNQLPPELKAYKLLLSACMLRHEGDLFLDNMSLDEFVHRAAMPVAVVGASGQELYDALHAR